MEVFLKADTIFEIDIYRESLTGYTWKESRTVTEGFFKKKDVIIPEGWVEYEYESPVSTGRLLERNPYLMVRNNQIWKKTRLDIHFSGGSKETHSHVLYFENPDEADDYARSLAKNFPHIYFKK